MKQTDRKETESSRQKTVKKSHQLPVIGQPEKQIGRWGKWGRDKVDGEIGGNGEGETGRNRGGDGEKRRRERTDGETGKNRRQIAEGSKMKE